MVQDIKEVFTSLVQSAQALLQEESLIIANETDANYFRSLSSKPIKKNPHQEPIKAALSPKITYPEPPKIQTPPPLKPLPSIVQTPPPISATPIEPPLAKNPPPSWISKESKEGSAIPNFTTVRSLLQRIAPQMPIIHEIPNDQEAKKIANRWKTKNQVAPISILYFSEPDTQKEILISLSKAIDIYFGPARLIHAETIEKEDQWNAFLSSPDLKWIISCDYTLWQLSNLMRHYKELPSQKKRLLGNIPLFLLPDLSLYLKDPLLKKSLWKALCQTLSS